MDAAARRGFGEFESANVLFDEATLKARAREIGEQLGHDYADCNPLLVTVLRGGVVFLADLIRSIGVPHSLDFIAVYRPPFDPEAAY
jgi:hypoxanthine phosphoribosyltransferase